MNESPFTSPMFRIGGQELVLIFLVFVILGVIYVLPMWFICKKAGLSPWLSLIAFIPLGKEILLYLVAFIPWPSLRDRDRHVES